MFRLVSIKSVMFAAACGVASSIVPTAEAEFLRVPSSCPQFWGYGYGAGYHAPQVRAVRPCPPHVQRRVVVPTYPHCRGDVAPTPCSPAELLPAESDAESEEVPAIPTVAPLPDEAVTPLDEIPAMPTESTLLKPPVSDIELDEPATLLAPVLPPPSMMAQPTIVPLFSPPQPIPR